MISLGIDTSSAAGSIALSDGDRLVAELNLRSDTTHSARLLPAVLSLTRTAAISLHEIDVFAVATGPGSFTGLRIGMATAKGLALATGRPLTGFSTLETMALTCAAGYGDRPTVVCVLLDAGRGEVYRGLFRCQSLDAFPITPEATMLPTAAAEGLPGDCVICGDGLVAHHRTLEPLIPDGAVVLSNAPFIGVTLARRALVEASRDGLEALPRPIPNYLRLADAERTVRK